MNISRFHISCIQKTDNTAYFTVGGALHILEQYVSTICFSSICVCGLPMNERRQRACAKSRPRRCGENVRERHLLSEYASYIFGHTSAYCINTNITRDVHISRTIT
jgi:hypothetical protein